MVTLASDTNTGTSVSAYETNNIDLALKYRSIQTKIYLIFLIVYESQSLHSTTAIFHRPSGKHWAANTSAHKSYGRPTILERGK